MVIKESEILDHSVGFRGRKSFTSIDPPEGIQKYSPLELLIVSDNDQYRNTGEKYYTPLVTPEGRTLFKVTTATKKELDKSISLEDYSSHIITSPRSFFADILLFDLRKDLGDGLNLLDNYLSMHQGCFTIVSIEENNLDNLVANSKWQNLQREIEGTAFSLTQSHRFPKAILQTNYEKYFEMLYRELLGETNLSIIRNLKSGQRDIIKRIIIQPTGFSGFSKTIREKYGSSALITQSLDRIAEFSPDETREELRKIQPSNYKWSVPQHCYPPFEDLIGITPKQVIEAITKIDESQKILSSAIYLHFPFCPSKCDYCDYFSMGGFKDNGKKDELFKIYIGKLKREIELFFEKTGLEINIPTGIAFGGGTPILIPPKEIYKSGDILDKFFPGYKEKTQLTFEVGPGTTTEEKLVAFREIGATRASIGLQSIDESLLGRFRRWFTTDEGKKSIEMLLNYWPDNTNIDLMYGFQDQTFDSWERDLDFAIGIGVPSITTYNLRVSNRTRLPELKFRELYENMSMQVMAITKLTEAGYKMISDNQFVKSPGNQPYIYRDSKKRGGNTLGFGASAYSFLLNPNDEGITYHNIGAKDPTKKRKENLDRYIEVVEQGNLPVEIGKVLTKKRQMRLFMIQGLKLSGVDKEENGVDTGQFNQRYKEGIYSVFPHLIGLKNMGLVEEKGNYLGLTYKGLAFEPLVLKTFYTV
ncbi:MAG: coproporphyrinogen-III oxidase family protein [Candidatus Thorarchaeota archaeon]